MEADKELREKYPEMGTLEEFEEWLAPRVRAYQAQNNGTRAVSTIPVVFHIIHNGTSVGSGDNISATYIDAQLVQLNNDFRKILGTSGDNSDPRGADSELEFCMATVDPSGNTMAEAGINRINRSSQGWSAPPYGVCLSNGGIDRSYIDNTIKPQSQWDPNQYLNIWIMDLNCGLLGYAQFPSSSGLGGLSTNGGAASTDGVVVLTNSVGSTTIPNPNGGIFNAGRTLTHELGHFFGLRHIWGDSNCGNDFCNDTPTQQGPSSGCPNTTTCDGQNDMVENYMDYSRDNCMNIFTQNQKDRMQTVMANSPRRGSLANSTACSGGGGGGGPTCSATVSSFPYSESFESGTGSWSQSTADDFDWARRSGSTPSSGTGPSSAASGSFYMYVEASSPNYPSRNTIFNGPCFDLSGLTSPEFSFQYHMLGSAVGTVSLQASTDGSSWATVWTLSGDQGSAWNSQTVDLSSYAGQSEVRLRFNATTASSWQGDICIDGLGLEDNTGGGGGPTCTDVTVSITLDNYPAETSWSIVNSGGTTVASGSGYSGNGSTVTETVCLDDGCYDFTINDSYGDGICCAYGNGSYNVTVGGSSVASGGSFGSSETTNFCLGGGGGGGSCPAIDFSSTTINSYGGSQDNGSSAVQDGGATLLIQNNAWKSISLNYTVTANTVIEFDFRSTDQGEIHGIGFDSDNGISSNRTFKVHGTQNWGIGTYDNYSGTSWTSYTITVGAAYTGSFDRLFFVCDDDAGSTGNSYFRNVKIYEGSCGTRVATQGLRTTTAPISTELSLAPNPANDLVMLRFKQKEANAVQVSVMNTMGQAVLQTQFPGQAGENQHELNIADLAAGAYFVVMRDGIRTQTKRLVIER